MQSAPAAPQPINAGQVASDQSKSNVNTAVASSILNNTNQVTPYGSLAYNQTGGQNVDGNFVPQYTATQTLSPGQQGILDRTTGVQTSGLDIAGRMIPGLENRLMQGLAPNADALRGQAYDALMGRARTDLDRSRASQQVQLANQGIGEGSEAWKRAGEGQDQALVDASNQATIQAGNLAGQNLQQDQALRNQGISEIYALLGGGPQNPNFVNTPQGQVQPTDVIGPTLAGYQGQMNIYNQGVGQQNAVLGGLFGLGGAALGGVARTPGAQRFFGLA